MARGWRYIATRLNGDGTETVIDDSLPLTGVSIENVLSGDSSINATISPAYLNLKDSSGQLVIAPWSTAIYAEQGGEIRAGGIVTNPSRSKQSLSIEAVGFTGYAREMPWIGAQPTSTPSGWSVPAGKDGSGFGVRVDPIDMMRVIWAEIQSHPGGNIGLQFAPTTTGGAVTLGTDLESVEFDPAGDDPPVTFEAGPYKLNWYTNHDLGGDIDTLAADTPFDFVERHYWSGDQIIHYVDIGYPRIGRKREDIRFVYGRNVYEEPDMEVDSAMFATGVMVLGAGEGSSTVRYVKEPNPTNSLRRIAVVTDDRIKSYTEGRNRADREYQARSKILDVTTITAIDHPDAPFGSVGLGDEVLLEGRGDWGDFSLWVRVTAISYSPESSTAQYTVTRTDKMIA